MPELLQDVHAKRREVKPDEFQAILIVCTRQIGDVLLTTPLIRAAKERWPQARIDVLGFAGTLGMLEGNPDVSERIEVQPGSGWWASAGLIRRIWRRYDLALVTQRSDRAFFYGLFAARKRSGFLSGQRRLDWWKRPLLAHGVVIRDPDMHVVSERLTLLDPWLRDGDGPEEGAPLLVIPPKAGPLPPHLSAQLRARYVVVHAPSLWRYKQWPIEHFRVLLRGLLDDGLQVVLSGSASANDQACIAVLRDLAAPPALMDVSGLLDFGALVTLMRGAALYVGPDTSITHLAAACSVPVIAIYGPTPPTLWGPWPQGSVALQPWRSQGGGQRAGTISLMQGSMICVPCRMEGCERHRSSRADCLEALSAGEVLSEARRRLSQAL